jgi:hypothetical protein
MKGVPLLAGLNLVPGAAQQQPCPGELEDGCAWGVVSVVLDAALTCSVLPSFWVHFSRCQHVQSC